MVLWTIDLQWKNTMVLWKKKILNYGKNYGTSIYE